MHRTFKLLAPTAIIGLSPTVGQAAEAPLPPRVNFVATPASQLHLGMTSDEVIRVMGKSARETDFAVGTTQIRKFELANAIRGQVNLRDGKPSNHNGPPRKSQPWTAVLATDYNT